VNRLPSNGRLSESKCPAPQANASQIARLRQLNVRDCGARLHLARAGDVEKRPRVAVGLALGRGGVVTLNPAVPATPPQGLEMDCVPIVAARAAR
jgi:hypothetical protein